MFLRLSATSRLAAGLAGISLSALLLAVAMGLFPQTSKHLYRDRQQLADSVATVASHFVRTGDVEALSDYLDALSRKRTEIVSIGVRMPDGSLLASAAGHSLRWTLGTDEPGTAEQMRTERDATANSNSVEIRFQSLSWGVFWSLLYGAELRYALFVTVVSSLAFYLYLRNIFRQLRSSKVVSASVRESLENLQEGLLITDIDDRVVLVNRAFEMCVGSSNEELVGKPLAGALFARRQVLVDGEEPWTAIVGSGETVSGRIVRLGAAEGERKTYSVSTTLIKDEQGRKQGALASFEDVTSLERKKHELNLLVEHLRTSTEEIQRQNRELERLATRDPLTGCLNRRSFYDRFDTVWKSAERYSKPLSTIMLDIDGFKKINDFYGHSSGDDVLVQIGVVLVRVARESDIVCRYGGEEFAVVLPETDIDEAALAAERFRVAIAELKFNGFSITASFGCAAIAEDIEDPQQLLDQADRCLYVAKNSGRNRVVRWDSIPDDYQFDEHLLQSRRDSDHGEHGSSIPFHAVTALVSALAYRHHATAAHSRRVADLCVAVAEGQLSLTECYTLEIAALLHDIGKIGVPDSILLKPGPLSEDEWEVMRQNDRIGVEIIRASFASRELTSIVEHYPRHYQQLAAQSGDDLGEISPLGARILAIADAYDSMVNDRVFRKGCSRTTAFSELRRCAGTQFDPELVERFIATVEDRSFETLAPRAVSKETALGIGLQIEQLSKALDRHDLPRLKHSSQRLAAMARREGAHEIAEKAACLDQILSSESDLLAFVETANQLLELCRATQAAFLYNPAESELSSSNPQLNGA